VASGTPALRLGLRYVRGLREEGAQALVRERTRAPFASIHDLTRRVPELRKDKLTTLADIGALNAVASNGYRVPSKTLVIPPPGTSEGWRNLATRDPVLGTRSSTAATLSGRWNARCAAPGRCWKICQNPICLLHSSP